MSIYLVRHARVAAFANCGGFDSKRAEQSLHLIDDIAAQADARQAVERRRAAREDRHGATGIVRQPRQSCYRVDLERGADAEE